MKMRRQEGREVRHGADARQRRPARTAMGVADWMMAFKQNGHARAGRRVPRLRLQREERARLLPRVRPAAGHHLRVRGHEHGRAGTPTSSRSSTQLPLSELYPVGKTSWAAGQRGRQEARSARRWPRRQPGRRPRQLQATAAGGDADSSEQDRGSGPEPSDRRRCRVVGGGGLPCGAWTRSRGCDRREQDILALERRGFPGPGAKERAIREELGLAPVRYYQLLNALLDDERALAHDPVTVNRLRRVRETRRAER